MLGGAGHRLRRSGVDVGGRVDRRAVGADSVAVARPVDLAPAGVGDHQRVAGGSHADGVQAAHAVHRDAQRMTVSGGGRHPGPQTGERAGTAAHHDRVEIGHRQPGVGQRGQHVRGEPFGVRPGVDGDPFGQHGAVRAVAPHDAGSHRRGGGVEGEDQALTSGSTPRSRSARRSG